MKLKKGLYLSLPILLLPSQAFAEVAQFTGNPIADGIIGTIVYGAIGIVMAFVAYRVVDLLTPGNLGKDIAEGNVALAVLAGMKVLGICIIIAAAIAG